MATLDYLHFLADEPRVQAYRRAIEATVSAGDVVLDLGTGIGTYAMFAARAGARVLAVEAAPVIDVARDLAADNGLAEAITFLHGRVERLQAPARANVLVFEDFSPQLFSPETAEILLDVRRRWLEPGARSIPSAIRVMLAPVVCSVTYRSVAADGRPFGLDLARFTGLILNDLHRASWPPEVVLAEPAEVASVDPLSEGEFGLDVCVDWRASRAGVMHGLGLWMDLQLAEGVVFSNAPSGRSSGWDQIFLPMGEPVTVAAGDEIEARVATLGAAPRDPAWWSWRVRAGGDWQDMNTFRGVPLSASRLRAARLDHRPRLTARGEMRRVLLQLVDGRRTVRQIVEELRARFPEELRSDAEGYRAVASELVSEGEAGLEGSVERPVEARSGP